MHQYGLSEDILASIFHRVQGGNEHLRWSLKGVPEIGFYQQLHPFLKKWSVTRGTTKQAIGRFYIVIDQNFKDRGMRADNVYRLIERICQSKQPSSSLMSYGPDKAAADVRVMQTQMKECAKQVEQITSEYSELKRKFEESRKQLRSAQQALRDVTNEKLLLQKQRNTAEKKAEKFKKLRSEYGLLEELMHLQEENLEISTAVAALETELASVSDDKTTIVDDIADFTFQTKSGRRYSPAIRKLYYSLLSDQIPSSKIAAIIKMVIKCFNPSIDVEELKLPQRACADYMRREELKTISNAHKATVLSDATNKGFLMNTDGTTKFQKKLGGVAINNMVLSVNELPDGAAESVIADVSRELEKLRKTAYALGMPNPNSINWTLLVASTSDSASTQKRINKLIEECREEDEAKYGCASIETVELVENFCSMHLGVNLRKAFLSGIAYQSDDLSSSRKYHPVDTLVHEFCKLFGKHGTPEYGCGVLAFPDFLALKEGDSSSSEEDRMYYRSCAVVKLDRQVGSRYFVSAANAAKIVFLADAAMSFLKYTGKDTGNKLEVDLLAKLQDKNEITQLRADGLMYFHVYADIVMLSKSNDLGKTVLDMNQHYLELKMYLQEVECDPAIVMDKDYRVFRSEERLYSNSKQINHRCHLNSQVVYNKIFEPNEDDPTTLYPLLISGAAKMKEKLCTYAKNQLPGGKYWDPEVCVRKVLAELKPSNDLCESILGLNDYLTTAIPNLHQMSRSNLVQVKKNQTMKWLHELPNEQQARVLDLAVTERQNVAKEYRNEEEERSKQRRQNMLQAHLRREALKRKIQEERDELAQEHLITTSQELQEMLCIIEAENISATKKKAKKVSLLKTQIKIRRKLLGQNIHIVFSHSRKQRPLSEVTKELSDFIDAHIPKCSSYIKEPTGLVGKHIQHQFEIDDAGSVKWYCGKIIAFDASTNSHEVQYEGEEEHCFFDLTVDLLNGDIKVLD